MPHAGTRKCRATWRCHTPGGWHMRTPLARAVLISNAPFVLHSSCARSAHFARLLQLYAHPAGLLQGISSSTPVFGVLCTFCREMSRQTGISCSSCTVVARFCSTCTAVADFACYNPAKRVSRCLFPVRPATPLHSVQLRSERLNGHVDAHTKRAREDGVRPLCHTWSLAQGGCDLARACAAPGHGTLHAPGAWHSLTAWAHRHPVSGRRRSSRSGRPCPAGNTTAPPPPGEAPWAVASRRFCAGRPRAPRRKGPLRRYRAARADG